MPFDGRTFERRIEVPALLLRALAVLRERGWCQNTSRDRAGRLCLYGAVREAGFTGNWRDLGIPWPAEWQDDPGRTQDEVEAWLEEQIARLERDLQAGGGDAV